MMASVSTVKEGAPSHGNPAHLLPPHFKQSVSEWLREDAPSFDYGGFVVGDAMAEARLLGKSSVRQRPNLRFCSDLAVVKCCVCFLSYQDRRES